jgi:ribonuclease BN (tRNA processing enzyme)
MRELESVVLHDIGPGSFAIGDVTVSADLVCHPGLTYGYRLEENGAKLAYLPDHEPALGVPSFPCEADWTSGFDLASGVDLLIHDAQYTEAEYVNRHGWGHSTFEHAAAFASLVGAATLVSFHHDPSHDDATLDAAADQLASGSLPFAFVPGRSGATFTL